MSHISWSPPTNALLVPLGTCRTEVEAGYCQGSPRSCWTRHRRENGWGAAALRAPGSTWKGELKPCLFLSGRLDRGPWI